MKNSIIFVLWGKTFRIFGVKISAGLSKLQSTCPDERLEKLSEKNQSFFYRVQFLSKKTFWLLPKIFGRFVKNAFYVYRGTFRWLFFLVKSFFSSFSDFICKNLSNFCRKTSGRIVKLLRDQRNILGIDIFLRKLYLFFFRFPDFEQKILGRAKTFQQVCQNCILRLPRNVSMIVFWEKFLFIIFGPYLQNVFDGVKKELRWSKIPL